MTLEREIPRGVLQAIRAIADYGTQDGDEEENWIECGRPDHGHIWLDYKKVIDWLDSDDKIYADLDEAINRFVGPIQRLRSKPLCGRVEFLQSNAGLRQTIIDALKDVQQMLDETEAAPELEPAA